MFWLLLALTAATRLAVALADYRSLIANDVVQDDAFYYLKIAANVVAGDGLTFDRSAPTNGFHPLYLLLLLPIMALAQPDLALPIQLAGLLLSCWSVATGAATYALLSMLGGGHVARFGLLLWAISPYFILFGVNGLETGVATLFVVLLPALYLRWFVTDEPLAWRRAVLFGLVSGLAILARIDLVLLLAAIGFDWVVRTRRGRGRDRRVVLLALATTAAVWLPWGLTSRIATGHWLPTSGAASGQIARNFGWLNLQPIWTDVPPEQLLFDPDDVPAAYRADVLTKLVFVYLFEQPLLAPLRATLAASPWVALDAYVPFDWFRRSPPLGAAIALMLVLAVGWWRRRRRAAPARNATAARLGVVGRVVAVYLLLNVVGYTFYSPAHWYFSRYLIGPILLGMIYVLGLSATFLASRKTPSVPARIGFAICAVAIVACLLAQWRFIGQLRWSPAPAGGFLGSWQALSPQMEASARVGAFQSGIYGYFGGREVLNLDGKVNRDAFEALRHKRLHEYLRAENIRYVLDWDWVFVSLCLRYDTDGTLVVRSLGADERNGVHLYEVSINPAVAAEPR